jgi:hypothetical protein
MLALSQQANNVESPATLAARRPATINPSRAINWLQCSIWSQFRPPAEAASGGWEKIQILRTTELKPTLE